MRISQREFLPDIHAGRAQAYLEEGDRPAARRAYMESRDAARATGNHAFVAKVVVKLLERGPLDGAHRVVAVVAAKQVQGPPGCP